MKTKLIVFNEPPYTIINTFKFFGNTLKIYNQLLPTYTLPIRKQ